MLDGVGKEGWQVTTHLSPLDLSYNPTKIIHNLRGDPLTNLTPLLLRKILYFEIKPYQIKSLKFIVTSTHGESLMRIIDTLLEQGIFLSQIKVGILEEDGSVNLYSSNKSAISIWNTSNGKMFLDYNKVENLGILVRNL